MQKLKNKYQFKTNDAIVVIDGEYQGWIGYAYGNEDECGVVPVRLFAFDGSIGFANYLPVDYVKNVEPPFDPDCRWY